MEIHQFRYAADNLGYLVYTKTRGIAIDPGAADEMAAFATDRKIRITHVTNTHTHGDHLSGNARILKLTQAEFLDCRTLQSGQQISLDPGQVLTVIATPGHSTESVCFKGDSFVVTGDTLFNGTVGNCFSGDLTGFFNSLKTLMSLPDHYRIFAGHDYVAESMRLAAAIEPDNPDIPAFLARFSKGSVVVSTLADEVRVNPFVRYNDPAMIRRIQEKKLPCDTELQRFLALMELF